jgi:hypothetical protein
MAVRSFITWHARGSSTALCSSVRSEGYRGMRSRHQLRQHLHGFWLERSQLLGRELSAAVLAMPEAARTARYAELKVGWAGFVFFTGLPAGEAYESALAAARERGDAASEVGALVGRGRVAVRDGRWDDLRAAALVALDVAKATGDRALQRGPLHCLAEAARVMGGYPEARKWYWESIEISNAPGLVTQAPGVLRTACLTSPPSRSPAAP